MCLNACDLCTWSFICSLHIHVWVCEITNMLAIQPVQLNMKSVCSVNASIISILWERERERKREIYCITLMLIFVTFSTLVSACLLDHRQKPCSRSRQWFSFQGESLFHQVPSVRITASSNHHPQILGHVRWPTKVLSLFLVKCSFDGSYNESKRFKSCRFESF